MADDRPFRVTSADLELRVLGESDLDAILAIERGSYSHPWSEAQFRDCMGGGYEAWGAFLGEQLTGYLIHWQVLDEAHLMNLCVHGRYGRQGIGRFLLRHWIARMVGQGISELTLEVRFSNARAQALYESEGFITVGERPDYYPGVPERESARVMKLTL